MPTKSLHASFRLAPETLERIDTLLEQLAVSARQRGQKGRKLNRSSLIQNAIELYLPILENSLEQT